MLDYAADWTDGIILILKSPGQTYLYGSNDIGISATGLRQFQMILL